MNANEGRCVSLFSGILAFSKHSNCQLNDFLFTLFSSNTWKTMNILHLEAQSVKSLESDYKEKSTQRQIERFRFCEFCNKTYICDLFLKKKKIYQIVSYRYRRIWKKRADFFVNASVNYIIVKLCSWIFWLK